MGSISTGVGLMSGLDIQSIVQSLMKIEHRPIDLLQNQIKTLTDEKTAYTTISAQVLALKLDITPFKSGVTFRPRTASSSNTDVLAAQANSDAVPGSYTFKVRQLAQTHQIISTGFNDTDRTPVGTGDITIELGKGNLDRDTLLSMLNNQEGVRGGEIRITDRSGSSAIVDLSNALTVSDVLDAINGASGVNVKASVSGDSIVISDESGASSNNLIVEDVNGGFAAADLGILANVASDKIVGDDVLGMTEITPLKFLNDGNGIGTSGMGADINIKLRDGTNFDVDLSGLLQGDMSLSMLNNGQGVRLGEIKVTNKAGETETIDLSSAETVNDVLDAINNSSLNLSASIVNSKLLITDGSGGDGELKIEDVEGGYTASDLGIDKTSSGTSITGDEIYSVTTLGDVIRAIEDAGHHASNPDKLSVSISSDGNSLVLTDLSGGTGSFEVKSVNDSHTAEDLGIATSVAGNVLTGDKLLAGLNTVLLRNLNGGSGVEKGTIQIQDRSGSTELIDLSDAQSVQDVLDAINNASGVQVKAELNSSGTGIVISDLTNSNAFNFVISDVDSTMAEDLGIAVDDSVSNVNSGNNQLQYVSRSTLLSELNGGKGVSAGTFSIVDSAGNMATISVGTSEVDTMTVGDLIDRINSNHHIHVTASINSKGDGILLTDDAGGAATLKVSDGPGATTASDLNIAGEASSVSENYIDGSFEYVISVGGSETLGDLVDKINELGGPFQATIINDGTGVNAYRLSITSAQSGKEGRLVLNSTIDTLNLFDLVEPQDAVISFGGASGASSIITSSSTNVFKNTVPGLTLTANAVSDVPVTVSVTADVDSVIDKVQSFVDDFNKILDTLADDTKYDADTEQAGPLLGDYTVNIIRDRLMAAVRETFDVSGKYKRLSDIGISVGSDAKLQFDKEKFQAAYNTDSKSVEELFSEEDKGFGYVMETTIDYLTDSNDGVLTHKTENYDKRIDLLNDRIDYLNELLDLKEKRLYSQFYAMEEALAKMQSMQSALSSFTPISPISTQKSNT